jgi:lipoate-protein ligase B
MSPFSAIVPCGLKECDVTSMAKETGAAVSVASVEQIMVRRFENIFGISLLEENIETILSMAGITGACAQHGGK